MEIPNPFHAYLPVKIRKITDDNKNLEIEWENESRHLISKGYWVANFLINDIEMGRPIQVFRIVRNGVVKLGRFASSPVRSIQGNYVHTANSVYQVLRISRIEMITEDAPAS
jgi:hypothetical protein